MDEKTVFEISFTLAKAGRFDLADKLAWYLPGKFRFAAGFASGWGRTGTEDVFETSVAEAWEDYTDLKGMK